MDPHIANQLGNTPPVAHSVKEADAAADASQWHTVWTEQDKLEPMTNAQLTVLVLGLIAALDDDGLDAFELVTSLAEQAMGGEVSE